MFEIWEWVFQMKERRKKKKKVVMPRNDSYRADLGDRKQGKSNLWLLRKRILIKMQSRCKVNGPAQLFKG